MNQHIKQYWIALLLPVFLLTGCWQDTPSSEALQPEMPNASQTPDSSEMSSLPSSFSLPYFAGQTLDPITCPDGDQQTVSALLYEGLFELDDTLSPQKKLCASSNYDAATLTWTFALRDGVVFSDGSVLTGADVAASLQRAMVSPRYAARLSGLKSVSAGKNSVTVVLNGPNTHLPALLDIPIVKSGTESDLIPIGTGPYHLTFDDSGSPYLTANPAWWGGGGQPVERIELVDCGDSDSVRYQFTSRNVQLMTADLTGTNPVSATGNFEFHEADTTVLQYIGFNCRSRLFSSAKLRSALNLGINRDGLVSAYLSSHAKSTQFPVSPVSPLYPDEMDADYAYADFESAMTEAGYASGTTTHSATMIVNAENSFKISAARYTAAALSAFDIKIQVTVLPWDEYLSALQRGDYDLYYGEVKLGADWNLSSLLATGGSLNYGGFSDVTLDTLLASYIASPEQDVSLSAICHYLRQNAPILPICFKCTSVLSQQGVLENLTPTAANPFFNLTGCAIHLEE